MTGRRGAGGPEKAKGSGGSKLPALLERQNGRRQVFLMAVGEQIRRRRKKGHWTQLALASAVGISRSYLSQIERGCENPSLLILRQIAMALQCTTRDLLPDETSSLPDYGVLLPGRGLIFRE